MIEGTNIPVFLASDENYAPFVAMTMYSILENTKSFIDFYILDSGISQRSKQKIAFTCKSFQNYSIEYVEIDIEKYFKDFPDRCHFSKSMYNRCLIPLVKPELKKVVYSDVDVAFLGDIKEFYDIDLSGFGLGAPVEEGLTDDDDGEWNFANRKNKFGINVNHRYFQSGNLLIDCDYWRKNNIIQKLFEVIKKYDKQLVCPDLDALNIVFDSQYKEISYRYSVCSSLADRKGKTQEFLDAEMNPFLTHFSGSYKPWNHDNVLFSEYFWHYMKKTAFYEQVLYQKFKIKMEEEKYISQNQILRKISKLKRLKYKLLSKFTFGKIKQKYKDKYRNSVV